MRAMRRALPLLLFPLAASVLAWAQATPDSALTQASRSPFELARYSESHTGFDWQPLWKSFGLADAPVQPCEQPGDCSTELITVLNPPQTILLIHMRVDAEGYVRYLGSESTGWRQVGGYWAEIRHYPARHEVTRLRSSGFHHKAIEVAASR